MNGSSLFQKIRRLRITVSDTIDVKLIDGVPKHFFILSVEL